MFHLPDPQALENLGYLTIFAWVFLEQLGLPIPALPMLVGAGVLISGDHLSFGPCLALVVAASFIPDLIWFQLGRARGSHVLNFICRISWKPDQCITTTTALFSRHGAKTLLFAKFVPGLSTLAPPMAGMARMPLPVFFWYDIAGCAVWAILPLGAGMFLHRLPTPAYLLDAARQHLPLIVVAVLGAFLVWRLLWRLFYRLDLHKELKQGLSPRELKALLDAGQPVAVVDVRHSVALRQRPVAVPTALNIVYKDIPVRHAELPQDRPVVVYCDCPTDEGSVAAVQRLRKLGVVSARPLLGGIAAWVDHGFETTKVAV